MSMKLGVFDTHPIQYHVPWFRYLEKRFELEVFYAHRQDGKGQASAGFGVEFDWDIPLLEGYPYRWLTNVARHPNARSFNRFDTPEVYDLIRTGRFDAFLVFGWNYKSAIQTIRACWQNHVPVLMRGDSHLATKRSWVKSALKYFPYRLLLSRLDAHLYVGQRNKAYLQHYGVPEDRLFFVPHFVDNSSFAEGARRAETEGNASKIRAELGIPRDAFVFLFVGKMIPKKRPADFVQACSKVCSSLEGSSTHALLVGDGPLRPSLELLAKPHAKQIHFAGFRNQTQLPAFYKASNSLVLPSDGRETWGLVVNEAAACSIPAIVSDAVGCAPDLIDQGLTGYTYPLGDMEALAHRMLALKRMYESNLIAIRHALVEKIACYSIEKATEGLESALGRLPRRST